MSSIRRLGMFLVTLAMLAAACGTAASPEATISIEQEATATPPAAPTAEPTLDPVEAHNAANAQLNDNADSVPDPQAEADLTERNIVAGVNLAIRDVDLNDVVFDTFDGGSVALADATEAQIQGLLNAIPPIDDPIYTSAAESGWLTSNDLVLGFIADDGSAWAHPHRVLNFHEIINTTFGESAVAITYCPLCGSGVVFDRRPNDLRHDGLLTFDNTSALYENDMVMVDEETHTYWWQVSGTGIVGNLTGTALTLLPSMTTSWAAWQELHPETMVLSNDQGRGPRYEYDPFEGYATRLDSGRTAFPTSPEAFADERLRPGTRVIGFDSDGSPGAVAVLANKATVVPAGDAGQVVFLDGRGGGALFATTVDGEPATFTAIGDLFTDSVAGSEWNSAGRAVSGPAAGAQLQALPSRTAYWFAWVSTLDGESTQLFTP